MNNQLALTVIVQTHPFRIPLLSLQSVIARLTGLVFFQFATKSNVTASQYLRNKTVMRKIHHHGIILPKISKRHIKRERFQ